MTDMQRMLKKLDELSEENTRLRNQIGDFKEEIRLLKKKIIKLKEKEFQQNWIERNEVVEVLKLILI